MAVSPKHGELFIFGGNDDLTPPGVKTVEKFDGSTWTGMPGLTNGAFYGAAAVLNNYWTK